MKLRSRLAVTAFAAALPTMAALYWFDAVSQHHAAEQLLSGLVAPRAAWDRARCEASPETWGSDPLFSEPPPNDRAGPSAPVDAPPSAPPPSPAEAIGPDGPTARASPPPRAEPPPPPPPIPPRFGRRPRPAVLFAYDEHFESRNPAAPRLPRRMTEAIRSRDVAVDPAAWMHPEARVLVRTAWGGGPCAFMLAEGTLGGWGAILPDTPIWLLPVGILFAALLAAVSPAIGRIRRLTHEVRRSASRAYESSIDVRGSDEVAELARAFDVAGREIRSQLRAKEHREAALREFVSNTTHDVMTPLTVLQGHLTTLRERAAEGKPLDAAALTSAMDEAHYMGSLVHNLAAAARLEVAEAKLQPSAVDLGALVARVMGRHTPIARERGVSLDSAVPTLPIRAWADVTLLEQAVSNVTYNAVRYNRRGGHVAIILEASEPARFTLRVIDDGPGIDASSLSFLRKRGARGDEARTRAPEGQGLGLHIAFRAAELHGYSLRLGPSEHGGLEVTFEGAAMA